MTDEQRGKGTPSPPWWPEGVPYDPSVAADAEDADTEELEAAAALFDRLEGAP